MSAIITDQFRILNSKLFTADVKSTDNSYYCFVGLPNPTDYKSDWNDSPTPPKDSFSEEDDYWDTMVSLKKIKSSDVKLVIRKNTWKTGTVYDMYRNDISRDNQSVPSGSPSLYGATYYVINDDFRVYICLYNGVDPDNPNGRPSLDQPNFTGLEPRPAGTSGDGYIWKYLFTIKPTDILKFDSTNFIPVPDDWETSTENSAVRDNASTSGQIKIATITNRGIDVGPPNTIYTEVPISGDGSGAKVTVTVGNDSTVESIVVSSGGSGYTYGTVNLAEAGITTSTTPPSFDVIIPPQGGHGADIYRELGAKNTILYVRIENDENNPDFIVGNEIARFGIIKNPSQFNSISTLNSDRASALYALKLVGTGYSTAEFTLDGQITQTIGTGVTAIGRVASYDKNTGVIKYWQDRTLVGFNSDGSRNNNPIYGFELNRFTASPSSGGSINISGGSVVLGIDTSFSDNFVQINNKTYNLGQSFQNGVSNPEVQKYSGDIIYVDNRPSITRSINQKEDIKVILQF